jgi:integrase/recombinase XerD
MTGAIIVRPQPRAWLERSVLQPYVPTFEEHLDSGRYASSTKRVYLCCVAHFARWLTRKNCPLTTINEKVVDQFVLGHLSRCRCPDPVRRVDYENRAALARLLEVLRAKGAIPDHLSLSDHIGHELVQFDGHMRDVEGLALNTRRQRCHIIRRFLVKQFGARPIELSKVDASAVRRFVLGEDCGWTPGTIRAVSGAIACYLRFRGISGDQVGQLLMAIPRAANWSLASLPQVFSDAEVEQLLRSFDRPFPSHRRAYAMVRCLTDLGLRCCEVVKLRLDDIDWREGKICLTGTKTRRADILPLPAVTGDAIIAYLQNERPSTVNRMVFVRHVAPYDTPIDAGVVQRAVRDAYRRCGWTHSRVHVLRHTIASRLLRADASMKDIADVLRHRSLNTSALYAKVDVNRLAAVALPWPGSAS